jgi:hypothetical protein
MRAAQPRKDLRAICYEHHLEMKPNGLLSNSDGDGARAMAYVCTEPDCCVRFDTAHGYFMASRNGNRDEVDMVPKVRCFLDGAPMYLAEIDPKQRALRLWTCPQCGARRTNEEDLVGSAP